MTVAQEQRTLPYWRAHLEAIRQEMERNPALIVMGEDVAGGAGRADKGLIDAWGGPFGTTRGLIKQFGPTRVIDTPISEAGFIGAAVGAAMTGCRVWVELMFSEFISVALDQIFTAARYRYYYGDEDKPKIPLVIKTWITKAAPLQSMFVHIPGLKVVAPSSPYACKGLLTSALRENCPVIFMDPMTMLRDIGPVPEEQYTIPLGKAEIARPGTHVTVVAISKMVKEALAAAGELASQGIEVEVIDPRTLEPLDEETILESVKRTSRLLVVDHDFPRCGLAGDIVGMVAEKGFEYLDAPVKRLTRPQMWEPSRAAQEDFLFDPTAADIVQAVQGLMS